MKKLRVLMGLILALLLTISLLPMMQPTIQAAVMADEDEYELPIMLDESSYVVIIAPKDSVVSAGRQNDYYTYTWTEPVRRTTRADGSVKYIFEPNKESNTFFRVQHPEGVTYWNFEPFTAGTKYTVTNKDLHIGDSDFQANTVYPDFEYNDLDIADIYLNINEQGYLSLKPGQSKELDVFRNWYAVNSTQNSKTALPDVHYEVVDPSGAPSDLVTITPDGNNSCLATLNAGAASGMAIVKVTYDAMTHMDGMSIGGADPTRLSAIRPECTGIFVVTVGEDGRGINLGMSINEDTHAGKLADERIDAEHDILYYAGDEGVDFSFTPEDGTTVSVARGEVSQGKLQFSGFTTEGVQSENSKVTLTDLKEGRHIVKVEKDGLANYQVLTVRKIDIALTDAEGTELPAEHVFNPGDTVNVTLKNVDSPQEKLPGWYNNNFTVAYYAENDLETKLGDKPLSNYGRYDFSSLSHSFEVTIPENWEEETFSLVNGAIALGGFSGGPAGSHRNSSYLTGKGLSDGSAGNGVLGRLPDITLQVKVEKQEPPAPKPADYTAVETAKAKAEALDRTLYTEDSLAKVDAAVTAVVEEKTEDEQSEVDAMAKAIEDALVALEKKPEPQPEPPIDDFRFDDVKDPEAWFYHDVYEIYNTKNEKGTRIMSGYANTNLFGPADNLNRASFAVMLHRLANEPDAKFDANLYGDVKDEKDFFVTAVMWAREAKVITGYENGNFGTSDPITREQLATILYRYANYQKVDVKEALAKGDLTKFNDGAAVSKFAQEAVKWANGAGILTGKENGTRIDPQGNAARAEVAAMFIRYIKYISQ